jgi:hypothetical protein
MKKLVLLSAFTQLLWCANAQTTNGLIAKWSFNNANANDEIGTNDGTVNGAVLTADRFGNANMAYEFDGVDDLINFGTDASIKPVEGTVSVWAKMIAVSNTGSGYLHNPIFLSKNLGHSDAYYEACGIGIRTTDNRALTIATDYPGFNEKVVSSINPITLNNWIHYVATYDEDSVSFYIDGVLQNRIYKGFVSTFSLTDPVLIAASGSVINARFFHGAIDDVRIYNRVLDQEEVDGLFNEPNPATLGINESVSIHSQEIIIYPNPAQDVFTISELPVGAELHVLDITGKIMFNTSVNSNQLIINTDEFSNGIYLINVYTKGSANTTKKLIVNK